MSETSAVTPHYFRLVANNLSLRNLELKKKQTRAPSKGEEHALQAVELDIVFICSLRSFTFGRRKSAEHRGIGSLYDVLRHCVDGFLSLKKTCLYYIEMSQHPNTTGKTSPRHVQQNIKKIIELELIVCAR